MRPALALVLGAVFTTCAVGCTFLISFDDVPDAGATDDDDGVVDAGRKPNTSSSSSSSGDTSSSSSSGEPGTSSSSSSSSSSGGAAFPPPCDATIDLTKIDCTANALSCGTELPANAALKPDDLVECDAAGKAKCVRHCSMGCAAIDGLPSQCANCLDPANANIWYCGKQMSWVTASADVAIHCANGKMTGTAAVCGLNLCHKTCTRTTNPLPGACCQSNPE